jgi:cytochrome b561
MMNTLGQPQGYDLVAKLLHWLIAGLLVVQYAIGWVMPEIHRNTPAEGLISLHLSFGALIVLLVLVRLGWRLTHAAPPPVGGMPRWQALAAQAVHALLYVLLVVLPVLGWMNASYRGYAVSLFDVVPLPALVAKGSPVGRPLGDVHILLSYAMLGVIGLHVLAALYHRFVLRDEVLQRMLPAAR